MIQIIEQNKPALAELCRRFQVRRLDLFGSAATGAFAADTSDLDFVVSFVDTTLGIYADRYLDFAEALERLFQCRVDLLTERSIRNPDFSQAIEATRQPVYGNSSQETAV